MKILYVTPNFAHHALYATGLYLGGHEITVLTDNPVFHRNRLLRASFHDSYEFVRGPFAIGFLRSLVYKSSFSSRIRRRVSSFAQVRLNAAIKSQLCSGFDFVIAYRNTGLQFVKEFQKKGAIWVTEEVNSHASRMNSICREERNRIGCLNYTLPHSPSVESQLLQTYRISDYIMVPSTHTFQSFLDYGISSRKLILNSFGCPPPLFSSKNYDERRLNIVCISQVHYRKGLKYLVDAVAILKGKLDPSIKISLSVVGSISDEPGFDVNTTHADIHFLRVMSPLQIRALFASSHIYVLPTLEEGLSISLGEALAHGLPVITTPLSGISDFCKVAKTHGVAIGNSVSIVPERDPCSIANAIASLYNKKDYEMASVAALAVANANSWTRSTRSLSDSLISILKTRNSKI